jgi:hypothetical protein
LLLDFDSTSVLGTENQNLNPFGKYLMGIHQDLHYSMFLYFHLNLVLAGGNKHPNSSVIFNITESRKKQLSWDMNIKSVEAEMGIKFKEAVKAGSPKSAEFFAKMDQLRQQSNHGKSPNSVSPETIITPAELEKFVSYSNLQNTRNSS